MKLIQASILGPYLILSWPNQNRTHYTRVFPAATAIVTTGVLPQSFKWSGARDFELSQESLLQVLSIATWLSSTSYQRNIWRQEHLPDWFSSWNLHWTFGVVITLPSDLHCYCIQEQSCTTQSVKKSSHSAFHHSFLLYCQFKLNYKSIPLQPLVATLQYYQTYVRKFYTA